MFKPINILTVVCLLLLTACRPSVPKISSPVGQLPVICPDYTEVTIPCNLCPTNFGVRDSGSEIVARLSAGSLSFICGEGKSVLIDPDDWRLLLAAAKGGAIQVEVWSRIQGKWMAYTPFNIYVSAHEIDPYISYRMISPSYVSYENMCIQQRDLTSFDTEIIYHNGKMSSANRGQCINCHSYQNYHTDRMLFHIRKDLGGTIIYNCGKVTKVNLKTPETISAGVYPAWHPTEELIAFSTNNTAQFFHLMDSAKIEVFDAASDLILYDVQRNEVSTICSGTDQMECFPTWSPDGRWLYYTSAAVPFDPAVSDPSAAASAAYQDFHYNLYRRSFDPTTRQWGGEELVFDASAEGQSVSLPRLSPDGKWLTFAMARWGCFHVWHPEADIYAIQLSDSIGAPQPMTGLNSAWSDSYPSFSSNGRWLMTASRRDDNNYTRPYISFFDEAGHCAKPFEVPQESPAFYNMSFYSFNRPEFMVEPVRSTNQEFAEVSLRQTPLQAKFKE